MRLVGFFTIFIIHLKAYRKYYNLILDVILRDFYCLCNVFFYAIHIYLNIRINSF